MAMLLLAASILVSQQFQIHLQDEKINSERELELLSSLVQHHLQTSNYQGIEDSLTRFGQATEETAVLKVTSDSDFVIAEYKRQSPARYPYRLQTTINYSYRGKAILIFERDMLEVYKQSDHLTIQLIGALTVIGILLGFLFYAIVLRQREAQLLRVKTHELNTANLALHDENMQRRSAEEALFNEKELAEITLQSIGDAVITTDMAGNVSKLNPVAQQLTGWSTTDATGQPLTSVFHIINSQSRQVVANPVERVLATGQIIGLANHTSLIARNGKEYQIADSAAPILNKVGQISGVVLVFHDVSAQYHQQAELASREAELRKITHILPGPVTRVDNDDRYVFVSDVYATWFGKRPEEVIGRTQLEALGPELYAQFAGYFQRARAGETVSFEVTLPDPVNHLRHALVKVVPNIAADGSVCGYYTIGIDITLHKQAQEEAQTLRDQLLQATKMEAVGHLTAGIAHDFNNMLGAIMGNTELAQDVIASSKPQEARPFLFAILKASNRAKDLIAQMLTFSRKGITTTGEAPVLLLTPVIKEVASLLHSSIPSTVELSYQIESENLKSRIHAVHLHQIIVNLGINARDAIGKYGKIDITLSTFHANNAHCDACKQPINGDFVQITVRDTGSGIARDVLDKIFNPFFTTKEVGKGTGMGLSVVHGLVHSSAGHIRVETTSSGTAINILLPQENTQPTTEAAAPSSFPNSPNMLHAVRIMVVDDEPEIASLLDAVLSMHGAQVSLFTCPKQALASFEKNPQAFDLVITDETMPGLSGMHLAEQMLKMNPALPITLCTGYSEHANAETTAAMGIAGFFYKPVRAGDLLQKIQQILQKKSTT